MNIKRAHEICDADVQERPWTVRIDDSGFVTVVDANGMFVADFGSGPPAEARLTVEATDLLPRALARIAELERLGREAVRIGLNIDDEHEDAICAVCRFSLIERDHAMGSCPGSAKRLSEIAAAIGGDGV